MGPKENPFKRKNVLIVAIHVTPDQGALADDITIAREEGADGIIVIKDYEKPGMTDATVLMAHEYARVQYPRWWIGINLLESSIHEVAHDAPRNTSGLWIDDAAIKEDTPWSTMHLQTLYGKLQYREPAPMLFASVAFKYQDPVAHPDVVARMAEPYCDVVVTSGAKTGSAPGADKIKLMRSALRPESRLGIASGISVANVPELMDAGASVFIVNTSVSNDKGRISAPKLGALRAKIPR